MNLVPNAANAIVDVRKLTGYLLDPTHPRGASKAELFARFGFVASNWQDLRDALLDHVTLHSVTSSEPTPFGFSYEVEGSLVAPDGPTTHVLVVWFIRSDEAEPRLVTVVPSREKQR